VRPPAAPPHNMFPVMGTPELALGQAAHGRLKIVDWSLGVPVHKQSSGRALSFVH